MALLNRLTDEQITRNFTHYGRLFGVVPVYIGNLLSPEGPTTVERNGCPTLLLTVATALFQAYVFVRTLIDPDHEPIIHIKITGVIVNPNQGDEGA